MKTLGALPSQRLGTAGKIRRHVSSLSGSCKPTNLTTRFVPSRLQAAGCRSRGPLKCVAYQESDKYTTANDLRARRTTLTRTIDPDFHGTGTPQLVSLIDPARCSRESLFKLADAGMAVARLNMSHGDYASHKKVVDLVREYNTLGRNSVAIMLDTKGLEVPLLQFGVDGGVDYVALPADQSAQFAQEVKRWLQQQGSSIRVLADIDSATNVQKLDEILDAVDGAVVARGDLGAELPYWQSEVIQGCSVRGKPAILLTNMLEAVQPVSPTTSVAPQSEQAAPKNQVGRSEKAGSGSTYPTDFVWRRGFIFASIFLGYASFYLTRNSLNFAAPLMLADPTLGLDITQIGAMTSLFPIAYGASKFVSGVLNAKFQASTLLALGLMCTALTNVAFGLSGHITVFCALWALNGVLQGVGGPSCATILTNWFAAKERGTFWGLWSTSHNFGGTMAPLVVGLFAAAFGWRWGMLVPGIIGICFGLVLLVTLKTKPQDCGFAPVEALAAGNTSAVLNAKPAAAPGVTAEVAAAQPAKTEKAPAAAAKDKSTIKDAFMQVVKNPFIWALAFTYFFIYVVRQGVTSWFMFYLMQEKGAADAAQAAMTMSALEIGGLVGGSCAGLLSDRLIRGDNGSGAGSVGKRIQVVMGYTAAIAIALAVFRAVPADMQILQWLSVFAVGACIYGPQMLIGLCGAELVAPSAVGASQGLLGWVAYLGAANAGIPLSLLVKNYGWDAYFTALTGACVCAMMLLLPLINAASYTQKAAGVSRRAPQLA